MNKRQLKKRVKTLKLRTEYLENHFYITGIRNGKTYFIKGIIKAIISKKYCYFKRLKKLSNKIFIGVDISNGKDLTCKLNVKKHNGKLILKNVEYS